MTPSELEDKRTELSVEAHKLLARVPAARSAGDRELVATLIYAASHLAHLAECPMLHVVLDEVLEEDPSLRRAS